MGGHWRCSTSCHYYTFWVNHESQQLSADNKSQTTQLLVSVKLHRKPVYTLPTLQPNEPSGSLSTWHQRSAIVTHRRQASRSTRAALGTVPATLQRQHSQAYGSIAAAGLCSQQSSRSAAGLLQAFVTWTCGSWVASYKALPALAHVTRCQLCSAAGPAHVGALLCAWPRTLHSCA